MSTIASTAPADTLKRVRWSVTDVAHMSDNYPTMDDEEYQRELIARGDSDKDADEAFEEMYRNVGRG